MAKRLPPSLKVEAYSRLASLRSQNHPPRPQNQPPRPTNYPTKSPNSQNPRITKTLIASPKINQKSMDEESRETRVPLSEVVNECVKRWFQDTLKEAKNGDHSMQILVGQMYNCGYGVAKNEQKANAWISKASNYRSSAWKVCDKRPGYNASDSDSDEPENEK